MIYLRGSCGGCTALWMAFIGVEDGKHVLFCCKTDVSLLLASAV